MATKPLLNTKPIGEKYSEERMEHVNDAGEQRSLLSIIAIGFNGERTRNLPITVQRQWKPYANRVMTRNIEPK